MKEEIGSSLIGVVDKLPIAVLVEHFPVAKQLYRSDLKTYKDLVSLIKNYKENKLFLTNQGRDYLVENYTADEVFKAFNEVYGKKRFEEIEDYIISDFIEIKVFEGYQVLTKKGLEDYFCFKSDELNTYRKTILTKEKLILTNRLIGKMYQEIKDKKLNSKMICQWFFKFYPNMIKDPVYIIEDSKDYYSPYYFVKGLENVMLENDDDKQEEFIKSIKEYIGKYVAGYKGKTKKICRDILFVRIKELDIKSQEEGLSSKERKELLFAMDNLIRQKDVDALIYKGYMYYGGGAMQCDYKISEKCFLEAFNKYNIHTVCNPLGYIYYYGRHNNGIPDYKKAFKFYSIAALAGEDEAEMKLGDMYKNGYYVKKDVALANLIYRRLYDESLVKLEKHNNINSVLPDVAFRCAINDWDKAKNMENYIDAMSLFYIALVSLQLRIKDRGFYFDKSVIMPNIRKNIISRYKTFENEKIFCDKFAALKFFLKNMTEFTIDIVKQDLYEITLEFNNKDKVFCFDFMHYYGLFADTVRLKLKYDYIKKPKDLKDITSVDLKSNELILMKDNKKAGVIQFNNYEILDNEPFFKEEDFIEKVYHCCKAVYYEGGKEYTFLIEDDSLKIGHIAEDGQEVIITKIEDINANDLPVESDRLKHIIP